MIFLKNERSLLRVAHLAQIDHTRLGAIRNLVQMPKKEKKLLAHNVDIFQQYNKRWYVHGNETAES
jgi:hypothetical protein